MDYIMIYTDVLESVEELPDDSAGRLFKALLRYGADGTEPTLTGAERMAFTFIRRELDRQKAKYLARSEVNKANGAKGGRPSKNQEKQLLYEETKKNQMVFEESGKRQIKEEEKEKENNNKEKEKRKKPKKVLVSYAEFVSMQETEYQKLCEEFGEAFTSKLIDKLNTYKGSSGKKYASDYMAMRSWVIDEVKKSSSALIRPKVPESNPLQAWGGSL